MYYVYMLRCSDGSLYTGITTDPERRLQEHNSGVGAKYTRAHGPCTMVYLEETVDRSSASKREYAIKQLTKVQKEKLIDGKL